MNRSLLSRLKRGLMCSRGTTIVPKKRCYQPDYFIFSLIYWYSFVCNLLIYIYIFALFDKVFFTTHLPRYMLPLPIWNSPVLKSYVKHIPTHKICIKIFFFWFCLFGGKVQIQITCSVSKALRCCFDFFFLYIILVVLT